MPIRLRKLVSSLLVLCLASSGTEGLAAAVHSPKVFSPSIFSEQAFIPPVVYTLRPLAQKFLSPRGVVALYYRIPAERRLQLLLGTSILAAHYIPGLHWLSPAPLIVAICDRYYIEQRLADQEANARDYEEQKRKDQEKKDKEERARELKERAEKFEASLKEFVDKMDRVVETDGRITRLLDDLAKHDISKYVVRALGRLTDERRLNLETFPQDIATDLIKNGVMPEEDRAALEEVLGSPSMRPTISKLVQEASESFIPAKPTTPEKIFEEPEHTHEGLTHAQMHEKGIAHTHHQTHTHPTPGKKLVAMLLALSPFLGLLGVQLLMIYAPWVLPHSATDLLPFQFLLMGEIWDGDSSNRESSDLLQETEEDPIKRYTINLTQMAKDGRIKDSPYIERIQELSTLLASNARRNVVLVGDPGATRGFVEAVSRDIATATSDATIPSNLRNREFLYLNVASLLYLMAEIGKFESTIQSLTDAIEDAVKKQGKNYVFVFDFQQLYWINRERSGLLSSVGFLFKNILNNKEVSVIGLANDQHYQDFFKSGGREDLVSSFEKMELKTIPNYRASEYIRAFLRRAADLYPKLKQRGIRRVAIKVETLEKSLMYVRRHMPYGQIPGKLEEMLDQILTERADQSELSHLKLNTLRKEALRTITALQDAQTKEDAEEIRHLKGRLNQLGEEITTLKALSADSPAGEATEITLSEIVDLISQETDIPQGKITEEADDKLTHYVANIRERLIGQGEAVRLTFNALKRRHKAMSEPDKPTGAFIFVGPTGVGKTELAKGIGHQFFGSAEHLVRFDMSEYMENNAEDKLIGAPPGYIGYEEGGLLTNAVREHPYSVVLLDEIEKAHPRVYDLLLQILDKGELTDRHGRTVSFRNVVLVMTSNLGMTPRIYDLYEAVETLGQLSVQEFEQLHRLLPFYEDEKPLANQDAYASFVKQRVMVSANFQKSDYDALMQKTDSGELESERQELRKQLDAFKSDKSRRDVLEALLAIRYESGTPEEVQQSILLYIRSEVRNSVKAYFSRRPELLPRLEAIGDVIVFEKLLRPDLEKILDIKLKQRNETLAARGLELTLTPALRDLVLRRGYDPKNGARPLERAFVKTVLAPLSIELLKDAFAPGQAITADLIDGRVVFKAVQKEGELKVLDTPLVERIEEALREKKSLDLSRIDEIFELKPSPPSRPALKANELTLFLDAEALIQEAIAAQKKKLNKQEEKKLRETIEADIKAQEELINKYFTNLSLNALQDKNPESVTRSQDTARLIRVLDQKRRNGTFLINHNTAALNDFISQVSRDAVNGEIQGFERVRFLKLNLERFSSQFTLIGKIEDQMRRFLDAIEADDARKNIRSVIVFDYDELERELPIYRGGGSGLNQEPFNLGFFMIPFMGRTDVRVIMTTKNKDIQNNEAFDHFFTKVTLGSLSEQESLSRFHLYDARKWLEAGKEACRYAFTVLQQTASLFTKELTSEPLLGTLERFFEYMTSKRSKSRETIKTSLARSKARIKQLLQENIDEGAATLTLEQLLQKEELIPLIREVRALENQLASEEQTVDPLKLSDAHDFLAERFGKDKTSLSVNEKENLLHLEEHLNAKIIDQKQATAVISDAVRIGRVGLKAPNKPIGSFLLPGPTGVGKTETVYRLGAELGREVIRLDMSEFKKSQDVSTLIGPPPGYVGHLDSANWLTTKVIRNPRSIILFDEIDKLFDNILSGDGVYGKTVLDILLQILEDGRLTDSKGRTANFSECIVFFTSNGGINIRFEKTEHGLVPVIDNSIYDDIKKAVEDGSDEAFAALRLKIKERVDAYHRYMLRPEFLNRLDDIVIYDPLRRQGMQMIVGLLLTEFVEQMAGRYHLVIGQSPEEVQAIVTYLLNLGYSPEHGARGIKNILNKHLKDKLGDYLDTQAPLKKDDIVHAHLNASGDAFEFETERSPAVSAHQKMKINPAEEAILNNILQGLKTYEGQYPTLETAEIEAWLEPVPLAPKDKGATLPFSEKAETRTSSSNDDGIADPELHPFIKEQARGLAVFEDFQTAVGTWMREAVALAKRENIQQTAWARGEKLEDFYEWDTKLVTELKSRTLETANLSGKKVYIHYEHTDKDIKIAIRFNSALPRSLYRQLFEESYPTIEYITKKASRHLRGFIKATWQLQSMGAESGFYAASKEETTLWVKIPLAPPKLSQQSLHEEILKAYRHDDMDTAQKLMEEPLASDTLAELFKEAEEIDPGRLNEGDYAIFGPPNLSIFRVTQIDLAKKVVWMKSRVGIAMKLAFKDFPLYARRLDLARAEELKPASKLPDYPSDADSVLARIKSDQDALPPSLWTTKSKPFGWGNIRESALPGNDAGGEIRFEVQLDEEDPGDWKIYAPSGLHISWVKNPGKFYVAAAPSFEQTFLFKNNPYITSKDTGDEILIVLTDEAVQKMREGGFDKWQGKHPKQKRGWHIVSLSEYSAQLARAEVTKPAEGSYFKVEHRLFLERMKNNFLVPSVEAVEEMMKAAFLPSWQSFRVIRAGDSKTATIEWNNLFVVCVYTAIDLVEPIDMLEAIVQAFVRDQPAKKDSASYALLPAFQQKLETWEAQNSLLSRLSWILNGVNVRLAPLSGEHVTYQSKGLLPAFYLNQTSLPSQWKDSLLTMLQTDAELQKKYASRSADIAEAFNDYENAMTTLLEGSEESTEVPTPLARLPDIFDLTEYLTRQFRLLPEDRDRLATTLKNWTEPIQIESLRIWNDDDSSMTSITFNILSKDPKIILRDMLDVLENDFPSFLNLSAMRNKLKELMSQGDPLARAEEITAKADSDWQKQLAESMVEASTKARSEELELRDLADFLADLWQLNNKDSDVLHKAMKSGGDLRLKIRKSPLMRAFSKTFDLNICVGSTAIDTLERIMEQVGAHLVLNNKAQGIREINPGDKKEWVPDRLKLDALLKKLKELKIKAAPPDKSEFEQGSLMIETLLDAVSDKDSVRLAAIKKEVDTDRAAGMALFRNAVELNSSADVKVGDLLVSQANDGTITLMQASKITEKYVHSNELTTGQKLMSPRNDAFTDRIRWLARAEELKFVIASGTKEDILEAVSKGDIDQLKSIEEKLNANYRKQGDPFFNRLKPINPQTDRASIGDILISLLRNEYHVSVVEKANYPGVVVAWSLTKPGLGVKASPEDFTNGTVRRIVRAEDLAEEDKYSQQDYEDWKAYKAGAPVQEELLLPFGPELDAKVLELDKEIYRLEGTADTERLEEKKLELIRTAAVIATKNDSDFMPLVGAAHDYLVFLNLALPGFVKKVPPGSLIYQFGKTFQAPAHELDSISPWRILATPEEAKAIRERWAAQETARAEELQPLNYPSDPDSVVKRFMAAQDALTPSLWESPERVDVRVSRKWLRGHDTAEEIEIAVDIMGGESSTWAIYYGRAPHDLHIVWTESTCNLLVEADTSFRKIFLLKNNPYITTQDTGEDVLIVLTDEAVQEMRDAGFDKWQGRNPKQKRGWHIISLTDYTAQLARAERTQPFVDQELQNRITNIEQNYLTPTREALETMLVDTFRPAWQPFTVMFDLPAGTGPNLPKISWNGYWMTGITFFGTVFEPAEMLEKFIQIFENDASEKGESRSYQLLPAFQKKLEDWKARLFAGVRDSILQAIAEEDFQKLEATENTTDPDALFDTCQLVKPDELREGDIVRGRRADGTFLYYRVEGFTQEGNEKRVAAASIEIKRVRHVTFVPTDFATGRVRLFARAEELEEASAPVEIVKQAIRQALAPILVAPQDYTFSEGEAGLSVILRVPRDDEDEPVIAVPEPLNISTLAQNIVTAMLTIRLSDVSWQAKASVLWNRFKAPITIPVDVDEDSLLPFGPELDAKVAELDKEILRLEGAAQDSRLPPVGKRLQKDAENKKKEKLELLRIAVIHATPPGAPMNGAPLEIKGIHMDFLWAHLPNIGAGDEISPGSVICPGGFIFFESTPQTTYRKTIPKDRWLLIATKEEVEAIRDRWQAQEKASRASASTSVAPARTKQDPGARLPAGQAGAEPDDEKPGLDEFVRLANALPESQWEKAPLDAADPQIRGHIRFYKGLTLSVPEDNQGWWGVRREDDLGISWSTSRGLIFVYPYGISTRLIPGVPNDSFITFFLDNDSAGKERFTLVLEDTVLERAKKAVADIQGKGFTYSEFRFETKAGLPFRFISRSEWAQEKSASITAANKEELLLPFGPELDAKVAELDKEILRLEGAAQDSRITPIGTQLLKEAKKEKLELLRIAAILEIKPNSPTDGAPLRLAASYREYLKNHLPDISGAIAPSSLMYHRGRVYEMPDSVVRKFPEDGRSWYLLANQAEAKTIRDRWQAQNTASSIKVDVNDPTTSAALDKQKDLIRRGVASVLPDSMCSFRPKEVAQRVWGGGPVAFTHTGLKESEKIARVVIHLELVQSEGAIQVLRLISACLRDDSHEPNVRSQRMLQASGLDDYADRLEAEEKVGAASAEELPADLDVVELIKEADRPGRARFLSWYLADSGKPFRKLLIKAAAEKNQASLEILAKLINRTSYDDMHSAFKMIQDFKNGDLLVQRRPSGFGLFDHWDKSGIWVRDLLAPNSPTVLWSNELWTMGEILLVARAEELKSPAGQASKDEESAARIFDAYAKKLKIINLARAGNPAEFEAFHQELNTKSHADLREALFNLAEEVDLSVSGSLTPGDMLISHEDNRLYLQRLLKIDAAEQEVEITSWIHGEGAKGVIPFKQFTKFLRRLARAEELKPAPELPRYPSDPESVVKSFITDMNALRLAPGNKSGDEIETGVWRFPGKDSRHEIVTGVTTRGEDLGDWTIAFGSPNELHLLWRGKKGTSKRFLVHTPSFDKSLALKDNPYIGTKDTGKDFLIVLTDEAIQKMQEAGFTQWRGRNPKQKRGWHILSLSEYSARLARAEEMTKENFDPKILGAAVRAALAPILVEPEDFIYSDSDARPKIILHVPNDDEDEPEFEIAEPFNITTFLKTVVREMRFIRLMDKAWQAKADALDERSKQASPTQEEEIIPPGPALEAKLKGADRETRMTLLKNAAALAALDRHRNNFPSQWNEMNARHHKWLLKNLPIVPFDQLQEDAVMMGDSALFKLYDRDKISGLNVLNDPYGPLEEQRVAFSKKDFHVGAVKRVAYASEAAAIYARWETQERARVSRSEDTLREILHLVLEPVLTPAVFFKSKLDGTVDFEAELDPNVMNRTVFNSITLNTELCSMPAPQALREIAQRLAQNFRGMAHRSYTPSNQTLDDLINQLNAHADRLEAEEKARLPAGKGGAEEMRAPSATDRMKKFKNSRPIIRMEYPVWLDSILKWYGGSEHMLQDGNPTNGDVVQLTFDSDREYRHAIESFQIAHELDLWKDSLPILEGFQRQYEKARRIQFANDPNLKHINEKIEELKEKARLPAGQETGYKEFARLAKALPPEWELDERDKEKNKPEYERSLGGVRLRYPRDNKHWWHVYLVGHGHIWWSKKDGFHFETRRDYGLGGDYEREPHPIPKAKKDPFYTFHIDQKKNQTSVSLVLNDDALELATKGDYETKQAFAKFRRGLTMSEVDFQILSVTEARKMGLLPPATASEPMAQTPLTRAIWWSVSRLLPAHTPTSPKSEALFTAVFERLFYHAMPLAIVFGFATKLGAPTLLIFGTFPFIRRFHEWAHDENRREQVVDHISLLTVGSFLALAGGWLMEPWLGVTILAGSLYQHYYHDYQILKSRRSSHLRLVPSLAQAA